MGLLISRWLRLLYWKFYLKRKLEEIVLDYYRDTMMTYPLVVMVEFEAKEKFLTMEWEQFLKWFEDRVEFLVDQFNAQLTQWQEKYRISKRVEAAPDQLGSLANYGEGL